MRKFISISILVFVCAPLTYLQNLVPNGSMETKKKCPDTYGEINLATGWFSTLNSPDYFNACFVGRYSTIDSNLAGSQVPFDGVAYSAMVSKNSSSDYHEHQGIKLTQSLIVGSTYQCRMWVSLCDISSYASNKMGFQFNTGDASKVNNISQVYSETIISDKKNWVLISGSFVATSPFTHVFIGNFFKDENTDLVRVKDGSYDGAYYYVDSISVTPIETLVDVVLQPTTVTGKYKVLGVKEKTYLCITKETGEVIYSTNSAIPHMEIDFSRFGKGTYCVIAETINGDSVRKIITF